jgi:hypothetical protein
VNPPDYRSRSPSYYLEKIDPDILSSFKPEQIEAITSILKQAIPKSSPKIVDFRFNVDLIFSRFYLVLLVGKDFRKEQRQYKSRGITRVGNIVAAIILLIATNLTISALILLIAYLFKSAIGLDFLPNHFSETLKKIWGK